MMGGCRFLLGGMGFNLYRKTGNFGRFCLPEKFPSFPENWPLFPEKISFSPLLAHNFVPTDVRCHFFQQLLRRGIGKNGTTFFGTPPRPGKNDEAVVVVTQPPINNQVSISSLKCCP